MSQTDHKLSSNDVILYTTPTCHFCGAVKEFFQQNSVEYREINVAGDSNAAEEMIKKSGQMGVPVIDFRGEVIVGFNKPKLSELVAA